MSKTLSILMLSVVIWAFSGTAQANENLVFNNKFNTYTKTLLEKHAQNTLKRDLKSLQIAATDLNADGLDEFIVITAGCDPFEQVCTYKIWADHHETIVELGNINAKGLVLGNEYTHGVRNLLAYGGHRMNDFRYQLYRWEPERSQYIISGKSKK